MWAYRLKSLVFRTVDPAKVDFWSCDMGMDLHGTCHDSLALGIDDLCTGADLVDNLAILDGHICLVAFYALNRVEYVPVLDDIF